MSDGINLLVTTSAPKPVEPKNIRIIRFVGFAILFLIAGSSIVLFILISFSPLPSLQKEEQSLVNELQQYRSRVAGLTIASQRVSDLKSFLATKKDYPEIMDRITKQLPQDSRIVGVKIEKKNFTVSILSPSLSSLDTVINRLDAINEEKKTFTQADMVSLGINHDLSGFTLILTFLLI